MTLNATLLSLAHNIQGRDYLRMTNSRTAFQVVTLAPWQMWLAHSNPDFAASVRRSDATTIDGRWLSAILSLAKRPHEVVTGREIVEELFHHRNDITVAVVGSSDEAHNRLMAARPDWLCIGGEFRGEVDKVKLDDVVGKIVEHDASVVFVALGSPKQENWGRLIADQAKVTVIGIGGAVETVVGIRRPPSRIMQAARAEWLQRTVQDPMRFLPRIAQGLTVMPRLCLEAWQLRRHHRD